MNFEFSKDTDEFLKIIVKTAEADNVRIFFAGGAVRDNLLNKKTHDIDLTVEDSAIELSKKFPPEIFIKSIHKDFGVVKLQYRDITIDLASTRIENYPCNGCLPVIEKLGVSIFEDVKRRDFTVNSLYAEIKLKNGKLNYKLIDLVDGVKDINSKILKTLHDGSYLDDPGRIIRGLDFKYRFGFEFSLRDKILINECLKKIDLKNASLDRISEVFKKTLESDFQDVIFKDMINKKYNKILFGSLNKEPKADFSRLKNTLDKFNLDKKEKSRLYFNILIDKNIDIIDFKDIIEEYKYYKKLDNSQKAYLFYKTQNENIIAYSNIKLYLTGKKLLELNYKKGKNIGIILDELLREKIKNNNKPYGETDETKWVLKNFSNIG